MLLFVIDKYAYSCTHLSVVSGWTLTSNKSQSSAKSPDYSHQWRIIASVRTTMDQICAGQVTVH